LAVVDGNITAMTTVKEQTASSTLRIMPPHLLETHNLNFQYPARPDVKT
jgi:hypothetical protein